jgi:hypothetical protein
MKHLTLVVFVMLTATNLVQAAPATQPVVFDTHDGYFVSNKFEPDAPASFMVFQDQKAFDKVFGSGFVMNDKHHRLPKDAFESKMVVAAIKRGKAVWTYKVEAVTAEAGILTLRYSTKTEAHPTAEFACPLIVSIPKGDYAAVQFVEDGKVVKKIDLAGNQAAAVAGVPGAGKAPATRQASLESMKGWELYIWQDQGETFCSLLRGTNRLKSDDEITKAAVKGINAIKPKLDELKAGQWVTFSSRKLGDKAPQNAARELAEYCRTIGLKPQP